MSKAISFGWIMQPAMFDTPPGIDSRDIQLARDMIAANERHIEIVQQAGLDTIWVEDHMGWGEKAHLECFTNMAWLAGRHPNLRYGTMVCGQAFRNPAYLAKLAANMYLLTDGRFILGMGAGNNPGEHHEYGYEFLPPGQRVAQLEEAVEIVKALWSDSPATFAGQYYSIDHAYSSPRPDGPIPLMIGGMGEQKLLRLVAKYADWWCADIAPVDVFKLKNEVLKQHCAAVGRNDAEITRSISTWISIEDDSAQAVRWDNLHIIAGNPEEVARELSTYRDAGVQHFQLRFLDYPSSAGLERFLSKVLPRLVLCMNDKPYPRRVLFVFAWLVVGGEETEVRLLAKHLDATRYQLEVVACFRKPNMPEQTHDQLAALGVPVDRTPYTLSFDDTVAYLAAKLPAYDLVVACQAVPDVYPALERLANRPPLIEHGGLVLEATAGPKQFTNRYVGVCASIRDAAAGAMPDRPQHALEIPSMIDLAEFSPADRNAVRAEWASWNVSEDTPVIGWVGRLDRKKRVEDFIAAAAIVHRQRADVRFIIIGGPDAFMPEYATELAALVERSGLEEAVFFTGDRPDVPRLMAGLDVFVWLAEGEGMPHVIAEAGAACLPVVATRDNGSEEQISDGVSGLFVPHQSPISVAAALERLIANPQLRQLLGHALRQKVEREYSAAVVARHWEQLFDEVIAEGGRLAACCCVCVMFLQGKRLVGANRCSPWLGMPERDAHTHCSVG